MNTTGKFASPRALVSMGWIPSMLLAALVTVSGISLAAADTTVTGIPKLDLATGPLYAGGVRAKPTLTLALSVEYPTVGASYRGSNDYSAASTFLGYFNPDLCYLYDADADQFNPKTAASAHTCGGTGFSGNFMNWATTSSIDILRYALTGGDRIVDDVVKADGTVLHTTVLQRAVLPDGSTPPGWTGRVSPSFYNSAQNFPSKSISDSQAFDAMPTGTMRKQDGTVYKGTVFIANCLNHVYFGTKSEGSCSSPGNNANLGQIGSTVATVSTLPGKAKQCAVEKATCTPKKANSLVYYGAGSSYLVVSVHDSIQCSNDAFGGDPLQGTVKACYTDGKGNKGHGACPKGPKGDDEGSASCPCPTDPGVKGGKKNKGDDNPDSCTDTQDSTADGSNSYNPWFLTRVSVCETMTGTTADTRYVNGVLRNFCTQYPSGYYKPTGDLQTYSDKVRVAAFGYLMDNTGGRYGGVLRAPMKYVGTTAYDSNFNAIANGNPQAEWDATTGVFAANPMKDAAIGDRPAISGVINYLNQFGRTGDAPGSYKTFDPVGELYYEALRYLQGLPPRPEASLGMTDVMKDGFPVYNTGPGAPTTDDDAHRSAYLPQAPAFVDPQPAIKGLGTTGDYRCVANNIITIGDIHTHWDASLPGNTATSSGNDFAIKASASGNMPDFVFWTKVLAGFETNASVEYIDGNGAKRNTKASPANPDPITANGNLDTATTMDANRFYLDGAAYWANTHDIRALIPTPIPSDDPNSHLAWASAESLQRPGMRVTSYGIDVNETDNSTRLADRKKLNQFYLMGKYGGFNAGGSLGDNPFIDSNGNAATLWERDTSGDPQNYFLASDAVAMIQALDKIFVTATADTSGIAGTSITSPAVTVGSNSVAYRSSFAPKDWSSDLYPVTLSIATDGTNSLKFSAPVDAPWHASTRLDAQVAMNGGTGWKDRKIYAGVGDASLATVATAFTDDGLIGSQKQALLSKIPLDKQAEAIAQGSRRLAYLRGDRSNESPIGDKFRTRSTALGDIINSGIVYEGAPSSFITDPGYSGTSTSFYEAHQNRTPVVYVGANDGMLHAFNANTGDELFAYIPSPVLPNVASLVDTGYVHKPFVDATPVAGEAQLGTTDADWRTVLVGGLGGGGQGVYALDVTDPTAFDASKALWEFTDKDDASMGNVIGKPGIFKFRTSLPTAATQTTGWFAVVASGVNNYVDDGNASTDGKPVIFILDLSKAKGTKWIEGTNYWKIELPQASTSRATGVANFSVYAVAGVVADIYAGDLQGNVWALDFTQVGKSDWNFAKVAARTSEKPLFIAKDSSGTPQQITAAPEITGYGSNLILLFGTGRYLSSTDNSGPYTQQTAYAILDPVGTNPSPATYLRDKLQPLTQGNGLISANPFVWGVPADPTKKIYSGWYFDIPTSSSNGERFVSDFQVTSATVFANSIIPAAGGCSAGTSNSYQLSLFGGGGIYTKSTSGMLGAPVLIRVGIPVNGINPNTGQSTQTQTIVPVNFGSSGVGSGNTATAEENIGVRSWRQIFSYKEIKAK